MADAQRDDLAGEAAAVDDGSVDEVQVDDEPAVDDVLVLDELVLAVWEPTGQPRVDAALDLLAGLDPDDLGSQVPVFGEVHQQLRQVLADLDG